MIKNLSLVPVLALVTACVPAADAGREAQGIIELHERHLGFEVPGRLAQLLVQRGQRVEAGEVLAVLDDALDRSMRDARAQDAEAAQAQYDLIRSGTREEDLRATEAQLRGARSADATAQEQLARTRRLRAQAVVSQAQLDDAEAQAARTRSEREALQQRLAAQRSGARAAELRQAKARAESARAALAAEEVRLARYQLRAPVAGVVLDTTAEPGEVLAAGTPAAVLGETRRPYLDVFITQQDLAGVRVGASAAVRVDASREAFQGKVSDVARTTEFTPRFLFSPRERGSLVVRVRIDVDDPREELHAGVPAFARIDRAPSSGEARR